MRPTHLFAFTGWKGHGKSTAAGILQDHPSLPKPVLRMSFAAPIKAMCREILPLGADLPENKENPAYGLLGVSPRRIWQTLGTEWGRDLIHPDLWVEIVRRQLNTTTAKTIIFDDCRFENEAEMIHELGGKVIRVERYDAAAVLDEHASEKQLPEDLVDFTIRKGTSVDYLKGQLDALIN